MWWALKKVLTLPGLLINCGDSHTSTHGAFGALAFGIGATEVAHVLGHANHMAAQTKIHAHHGRRRLGFRRLGQGYSPWLDWQAWEPMGRKAMPWNMRRCHQRAVHGRPNDAVQHVD